AGGAESMSTAPYTVNNVRFSTKSGDEFLKAQNTASQPGSQPAETYGELNRGITAENVAEKYSISREQHDEIAFESQQRTARAIANGHFDSQIAPYRVKTRKGITEFKTDEHPRETSHEKLAGLKPVFKEGGTVTAGNSSGRNDGAAALLIMSEHAALKRGYQPKARIIAQASVGCSPELMGMGPVQATFKA